MLTVLLELFFALFAYIIGVVGHEVELKYNYNSSESYSCYSAKNLFKYKQTNIEKKLKERLKKSLKI